MVRKPFQFDGLPLPRAAVREESSSFERTLHDLTCLAANIVEAHSAFVFLPLPLIPKGTEEFSKEDNSIAMVASHSLCPSVIEGCVLSAEMGLIGWVARNHRSIHVSPFERDSRILGVYRDDQQLKSFIGIPIPFDRHHVPAQLSDRQQVSLSGVLACDSKKAFAFTKLQGKLLEDLGKHMSSVVMLHGALTSARTQTPSWDTFLHRGYELAEAVGIDTVTVMRIRMNNAHSVDQGLGTGRAIRYFEQMFRLIGQAIPPQYPIFRTPTGEVILLVDNMMADIYENKVIALAHHTSTEGVQVAFDFRYRSHDSRRDGAFSLERLVSDTAFADEPSQGSQASRVSGKVLERGVGANSEPHSFGTKDSWGGMRKALTFG